MWRCNSCWAKCSHRDSSLQLQSLQKHLGKDFLGQNSVVPVLQNEYPPGLVCHGKINVFGASLCDCPLPATVHGPPNCVFFLGTLQIDSYDSLFQWIIRLFFLKSMKQSLLTRQLEKIALLLPICARQPHILMYFSVAFPSFDGICHTGFNWSLAEKQPGLLMLACKVALVLFYLRSCISMNGRRRCDGRGITATQEKPPQLKTSYWCACICLHKCHQ